MIDAATRDRESERTAAATVRPAGASPATGSNHPSVGGAERLSGGEFVLVQQPAQSFAPAHATLVVMRSDGKRHENLLIAVADQEARPPLLLSQAHDHAWFSAARRRTSCLVSAAGGDRPAAAPDTSSGDGRARDVSARESPAGRGTNEAALAA